MGMNDNVVSLFPQRGTLAREESAPDFADAHRLITEGTAEPSLARNIAAAVVRHRDAWQGYQDAPADSIEEREWRAAEETALIGLLCTAPRTEADLIRLLDHLSWYTTEESELRGTSTLDDIVFAYCDALRLAMASKG